MGAEFLSQLSRGDLRSAAKWLVLHHGAEVLSLCRAMVRDESQAEDLAQDAFSRAFSGLSTFRGGEEGSPRAWLMTIARRRCIDHLRRQQVQPWSIPDEADTEDAPDVGPLPATLFTNRELVLQGLAALDESHRALVILRYRHGMDYDELAAAFGLKAGTVRMRVSRALAKMRATIEAPATAAAAPPVSAAAPRSRRARPAARAVVAPRSLPAPAATPSRSAPRSAPPDPPTPPAEPPAMGAPPPAPAAPPAAAKPPSEDERGGILRNLLGRRRRRRAAASRGRSEQPPAARAPGAPPPPPPPESSFESLLGQLDAPLSTRLSSRLGALLDQLMPSTEG